MTWTDEDDAFFGRPRSVPTRTATGVRPEHRAPSRSRSDTGARFGDRGVRRRGWPDPTGTRPPRSPRDDQTRTVDRAPRVRRPAPQPVAAAVVDRRGRTRIGVLVALAFVLFGTIVVRLVDVQFNQRGFWLEHGLDSRVARDELRVERGGIYDRNGAALALSVFRPDVVADPTLVEDPAAAAAQLAPILKLPEDELLAQLSETNRYQVLARNVDKETADRLDDPDEPRPAGIFLQHASAREYPSQELARSLVGRTFPDGAVDEDGREGRYGVEASFDRELRGEPGYVVYERERGGGRIASASEVLHEAIPGSNVYLTIDQRLQYATEAALTSRIEELSATEATAIVMRPSTGEVLAMSTIAHDENGAVGPTMDNRAVNSIFEPGSVNKMITIAAAMEEGQITPDSRRRVPDRLQIADKLFTDHDPHPVENWTTSDILTRSSNIGTIQIAEALGAERLDSHLRSFGFGSTTGSDVPGEVRGLLPTIDRWSGTTLGSIAIGQTLAVTPIQLLSAYNVIANDGLFVSPHTVGATDAGDGPRSIDRPAPRRVVSEQTATAMREMLTRVVEEGTGSAAVVPGYRTWGKTGTARIPQDEIVDRSDAYLNADGTYDYATTFVGGVDGLDVTILVMIKEPQSERSGGAAAAPVFAELASFTVRTLGLAPVGDADDLRTVSHVRSDVTEEPAPNTASEPSEAQG